MPRTPSLIANVLLIGSLAFACSDDSGSGDEPEPGLSFATDIYPILVGKCGNCHSEGAGVDYPGHGAADVDESYAAVIAENSQGEKIYDRILDRTDADDPIDIMPPTYAGCGGSLGDPGCLSVVEHDLIEAWVAAGTPP